MEELNLNKWLGEEAEKSRKMLGEIKEIVEWEKRENKKIKSKDVNVLAKKTLHLLELYKMKVKEVCKKYNITWEEFHDIYIYEIKNKEVEK